MAHTYADLSAFKNYVRDGGSSDTSTTNDTAMLGHLQGASRRVDAFCDRSEFGSGFGPRVGTNRYDSVARRYVDLADDLLSITSFTFVPWTASTTVYTPVADTDYYLRGLNANYDKPPFREIIMHGFGTSTLTWLGYGFRVVTVTGVWGYQSDLLPSTTTVASGLASDATVTTFTTSASPTIAIGQTIRVGSEDLYVSGLSGTTATVERAANGTTAATHVNGSAISVHRYPAEVVAATLQVALRRWKMRDAGLSGNYGGGIVPSTGQGDSEMSVLRSTVGHLRLTSAF